MIKTTTYLFGFIIVAFVFLLRDKKTTEAEQLKKQYYIEQEIAEKDSIIGVLHEVEVEFINEIKVTEAKIDSLEVHSKAQEHKIIIVKEQINDENTKAILCASDSTIMRILSEHHIKTRNN
jgi:hypothetical protein